MHKILYNLMAYDQGQLGRPKFKSHLVSSRRVGKACSSPFKATEKPRRGLLLDLRTYQYCITSMIISFSRKIQPRSGANNCKLVGLFHGASVADLSGEKCFKGKRVTVQPLLREIFKCLLPI